MQIQKVDQEAWERTVVEIGSSFSHAINTINQNRLKIALVCDEKNTLIAVISDGDVRRALLAGKTLDDSLHHIVRKDPITAYIHLSESAVRHLILKNKIQHLPIVTDCGRLVGLYVLDYLHRDETKNNLLVIMAGGKGLRLLPDTVKLPKPLIPLAGKPMIEHIIQNALESGFDNLIISVNYLKEKIKEHLGDGARFGARIEYIEESKALGTAGALASLPNTVTAPIVVSNCDIISGLRYGDLLKYHQENEAIATMAIRNHVVQNPFGVVSLNGAEIVGFKEKPTHVFSVNAGVYVLSPAALAHLKPNRKCDVPELFERLRANSLKTIAFPVHEYWMDVGQHADLKLAQEILLNRN